MIINTKLGKNDYVTKLGKNDYVTKFGKMIILQNWKNWVHVYYKIVKMVILQNWKKILT